MEILSTSWGGKAEHGILSVEACIRINELIITAKDSYYNDYSLSGLPESERVFSDNYSIEGISVNRVFLYAKINELLKKNHIDCYRFDLNDVKPLI